MLEADLVWLKKHKICRTIPVLHNLRGFYKYKIKKKRRKSSKNKCYISNIRITNGKNNFIFKMWNRQFSYNYFQSEGLEKYRKL